MKVDLVTTWNVNCGLASHSSFLSEALSKFVDVKICRVDNSFTKEDYVTAISSCDGDIVHIEHEWSVYNGHEDMILDILDKKRVPIVLTSHGGGYHRFFGRVAKIVVTNKVQKGVMSESIISIIPHGVTCYPKAKREKARKELGITKPYVVTEWGFILPHKGYELVLDAVKDRDDICFLMAGSEERSFEYWVHLQKIMKILNVKAEIVKTGFLSEAQIPLVFGATNLCCFPFQNTMDSATLRYALGSKVLSLASSLSFVKELFLQYGIPYISKDPWDRNFKVAIRQLLEKEDLTDFENRCEIFARENSWEKIAEKHYELYKEVLGENK